MRACVRARMCVCVCVCVCVRACKRFFLSHICFAAMLQNIHRIKRSVISHKHICMFNPTKACPKTIKKEIEVWSWNSAENVWPPKVNSLTNCMCIASRRKSFISSASFDDTQNRKTARKGEFTLESDEPLLLQPSSKQAVVKRRLQWYRVTSHTG